MILAEDNIKKFRDDDWVCSDPLCGNVNYKWRKCCNVCLKGRNEPVPPLVKVIGEDAAGKSAGVFKAQDWQCRCGNVNWARRQECNRCNRSKFDPVNMLSPEEIMRDEDDDNVSVHSSLSSPNMDSDETDDSGVVACGSEKRRKLLAMCSFLEHIATDVLGYSQEDFLNRRISLDQQRASTAMYYIVQNCVINVRAGADAGLPDLQATDEAAKSFLMNCDLLSPEQRNMISQMSATRIREKYLELMREYVEQITGISSRSPQMNPQNMFNQPPPPVPASGVPPVSASISATYMASQIQAPYPIQGQMQAPFQIQGQIQPPFQMPGQMQALTLNPQQIQAPFQMQASFPNLHQVQAPFPNQPQMPTSASDPTQMQAPVLVPVASSTPMQPVGPMQPSVQTSVSMTAQVQGSGQVPVPNSEHLCHGTDSVSRDMRCCNGSSSATCDSQHSGTKPSCTERCCDRKPVGCCNQYHCDNSNYEKHSCGNGPSMCCDRSHHDSRPAPHVNHHEKERSHSGGSPNAPSTEERRIIMKSDSKDRREEFYARRSPSPPPVYRRRHSPPDRHGMRYYHTAPRRDNSPRDRDRHSRRRYSPDGRYGRRN